MKNLILILGSLLCIHHSFAQSSESDELLNMSLEELMNIRIKKISILDVPHTHRKGELMLSYHYMLMNMKGSRSGTNDISTEEILEYYMVVPLQMSMKMHMLHIMYAPSKKMTFMAMGSYIGKSMNHLMQNGIEFTTSSQGISDLEVSSLVTLQEKNDHRIVGGIGLNLPTGSINETNPTPMNEQGQKLPYPMQIGSGTVDPKLSLTYFTVNSNYGWGADLRNTFRLYDNKNGYRFGNDFKSNAWYSKIWLDYITTTFRMEYFNQGKIKGMDEDLIPMMVYTADPINSGGSILNIGLGINIILPGKLDKFRIAAEGKLPIYQNLQGIQMKYQNAIKFALTYVI